MAVLHRDDIKVTRPKALDYEQYQKVFTAPIIVKVKQISRVIYFNWRYETMVDNWLGIHPIKLIFSRFSFGSCYSIEPVVIGLNKLYFNLYYCYSCSPLEICTRSVRLHGDNKPTAGYLSRTWCCYHHASRWGCSVCWMLNIAFNLMVKMLEWSHQTIEHVSSVVAHTLE